MIVPGRLFAETAAVRIDHLDASFNKTSGAFRLRSGGLFGYILR
jgi:hypothetical protein